MHTNGEKREVNRVLESSPGLPDASARERLILALLSEPTLNKAAVVAGLSQLAAYRLKRTPGFEEELRKARKDAVDEAMSHLQWGTGFAVAALIAILRGRTAPTRDRLRAADILLTHVGAARMDDLDALIEHVEKLSETDRRNRR